MYSIAFMSIVLLFYNCEARYQRNKVKPVHELSYDSPYNSKITTKPFIIKVGNTGWQGVAIDSPTKKRYSEKLLSTTARDDQGSHDDIWDGNGIDEVFPTAENEEPRTAKPYRAPGHWATPPPDSGIDLGFTPVQTYLQVRKTSTVQHLPRSEAIKEASSLDEVLNAHRLKEVLRTKKIQEVYSEEGYEDSGYDHGHHEREAEHGEAYKKHKDGNYKVKDPIQHVQDIADAESTVVERNNRPINKNNSPKVTGLREEKTSMEVSYMEDHNPEKVQKDTKDWMMRMANVDKRDRRKFKRANKYPSHLKTSQGNKRDFVSPEENFWKFPKIFEDSSKNQWGFDLSALQQRDIVSEPPKSGAITLGLHLKGTLPTNITKEKQKIDTPPLKYENKVRIPAVPTFGYIHSLTDAHYKNNNNLPFAGHKPKPIPSRLINMTEAFQPNEKKRYSWLEPKKLNKRLKRESQETIEEKLRGKETEKYEKELSKQIDEQEKQIIGTALKNIEVEKTNEEKLHFPKFSPPISNSFPKSHWKEPAFDSVKYPYFYSRNVDPYSPLRYASHPREFPRKSGRGMEFYDSKDAETQCDPIDVSLDNVPKEDSTWGDKKQPGQEKRIVGLGDKIQCMKNKYFGEDPLDSPFFKEDEIKKKSQTEDVKFHSKYHYQPNRTIDVYTTEKLNDSKVEGTYDRVKYHTIQNESQRLNKTEARVPERVIPVSETYLPELTTAEPIMGMRPPPMTVPFSIIRLPPWQKPKKVRKFRYRANCLQPITKMTITERQDETERIIYDCLDVIMIKNMQDGNEHFQIIPKIRRSDFIANPMDDSTDLRLGEVIEGNSLVQRRKRSAPSTTPRRKSNLFPNKSLLDKLVKTPILERKVSETSDGSVDLGDMSPDELNIKVTSTRSPTITTTPKPKETTTAAAPTTTTTITTTTTNSTQEPKRLESRPLSRLSGRDFLVRYHKTKGSKSAAKPSKTEFWKIVSTTPTSKFQKTKRTI